jgi:predicted N-acetyltransferase YhbS
MTMSALDLTIRPPESPAEIEAFFRLATETFIPGVDPGSEAARWQRYVTTAPDREAYLMRSAFHDGRYLGGYLMHTRSLRLGAARLRTGCISAVVTHPEHRRQGVAAGLMRDAISLAQAHRCVLLLLGGIPEFYHRFGYIDVLDITEHAVSRARIAAQPPSAFRVRPVTLADVGALLALYQRHYGSRRGSFDWSPAQMEHKLRLRLPDNPPLLAEDPAGRPCGYLISPWTPDDIYTAEIAADDWPALLALLQQRAQAMPAPPGARDEMVWPLPPDSRTFYLLADRLPVRSETRHLPREGWLARPAHLPSLFHAMLPEWQVGWRRRAPGWSGTITLAVGDEACGLELGLGGVALLERRPEGGQAVRLTPEVFTQLLFGFRPVWWAAEQPGQEIAEELVPVLEALFPLQPVWIAGSDAF